MEDQIPYDLIMKNLAGECTPEEAKSIATWRAENKANEQDYLEIMMTWEQSYSKREQYEQGMNDALEATWAKMDLQTEKDTKTISWFGAHWYKLAAAITVIAVATLLLTRPDSHEALKTMTASTGAGEKTTITLADGTRVWLNENSHLAYPEQFDGDKREVTLQGEGYFEVAKNPKKPFSIIAQGTVTKVLGTAFNVAAQPDQGKVSITVTEGKVSLQHTSQENIILLPGDKGVAHLTSKTVKKETNTDKNYMAWKTGKLIFEDIPLEEALTVLNQYYSVVIQAGDKAVAAEKVNMVFDNQPIEEVLEVIQLTMDLKVEKEDNKTLLKSR